jgi:hypothetical protein
MFALKLTLAPSLVAGVTLAGRRWGTRVAGLLAGLPVVGGPILLLVALEQGEAFAARTAVATTVGLVATIAFCVVYAWGARLFTWPVTLAIGWSSVFLVLWLLGHLTLGLTTATLLALGVLTVALAIMPHPTPTGEPAAVQPPWWDLPLRAMVTASLVVAVTTSARLLGPRWTGLLTPFPIATTVLATFTHAQTGSSARLLRALMTGLYGFIAFTTLIATTIEHWGVWPAFVAGLAVAAAANVALLALRGRVTPRIE